MIELFMTFVAGISLGTLFYGGLWYTVKEGTTAKFPGVWFLLSFLLRTSVALCGFYFVSGGHWQRMITTLAGFILARIAITLFTKRKKLVHENQS